MKISVIIPVYNVAPYIAACLQSVMRQTTQAALECILVDDCGPDNSMEVVSETLKSYKGPVDFKIVRHTQNRGLSAARNTGLAAATGDYIYFLDSDDEITPDCIERLSAPLQKEPYDLTIGECRIEGGSLPGVALQLPEGTVLRDREILHAYRLQQWYMMSVNNRLPGHISGCHHARDIYLQTPPRQHHNEHRLSKEPLLPQHHPRRDDPFRQNPLPPSQPRRP